MTATTAALKGFAIAEYMPIPGIRRDVHRLGIHRRGRYHEGTVHGDRYCEISVDGELKWGTQYATVEEAIVAIAQEIRRREAAGYYRDWTDRRSL